MNEMSHCIILTLRGVAIEAGCSVSGRWDDGRRHACVVSGAPQAMNSAASHMPHVCALHVSIGTLAFSKCFTMTLARY